MNLDKILNEMGKELLPSLTSKEDLVALAQLRKLYKKDIEEFTRKLKRINLVRKTEGLEPIHKNEVIGKSVKQDITRKIKTKVSDKKKDVSKDKEEKSIDSKILTQFGDMDNNVSKWKFFIDNVKDGKNIIDIKNNSKPHDHSLLSRGYKTYGKQFFILTYEIPFSNFAADKVVGVYNSPTPYKIVGKEVRFPELKKKISFEKSDMWNRPKIGKI